MDALTDTLAAHGINFDWTITPSTILGIFTFLAAIGTFRAGTRAVKRYFDDKKARELQRVMDEEERLMHTADISFKIDALIFAFIGSDAHADQDQKKKMFDAQYKEKMDDYLIAKHAREQERKRQAEEDKRK